MIREGVKTQTRRLKQPNLKIGRTYPLRENYRTSLPDHIKITDIYQQYLGDITPEDIRCEGFTTLDEFAETWSSIYGCFNPEDFIWVVEFQYICPTETFKQKTHGRIVGNRPKGVGSTRTHSELGS